jgi:hypothetical protein
LSCCSVCVENGEKTGTFFDSVSNVRLNFLVCVLRRFRARTQIELELAMC